MDNKFEIPAKHAYLMAYYYACGANDARELDKYIEIYVSPEKFAEAFTEHVCKFNEHKIAGREPVQSAFKRFQQLQYV